MVSTFTEYRRPDGRVSVRDHVAVIPTSVAASAVADGIVEYADGWARSTPTRWGTNQPSPACE